ncbi:Hypothetical predicted protein [Pelobates cultripes]|uniref:Endonuclease/exonuclease/phosphatase domain-containing protein n=1 Tax=Pelobates cultripes TaxID=61616 RepID=A0AAD1T602_PELCU|nr:Hypothetical predicted protein [Pelobates cultripes]
MADPNGRYLFLKGTIADHTYTFACLYSHNRRQHIFINRTLTRLESFREGLLVVAGDLNLLLDPRMDTSRGTSTVPTHNNASSEQAEAGGLLEGRVTRKIATTPIIRRSTCTKAALITYSLRRNI